VSEATTNRVLGLKVHRSNLRFWLGVCTYFNLEFVMSEQLKYAIIVRVGIKLQNRNLAPVYLTIRERAVKQADSLIVGLCGRLLRGPTLSRRKHFEARKYFEARRKVGTLIFI
jgi:hypothetical protein